MGGRSRTPLESGQGTSEYVGVLAVVALLFASLMTAGVGAQVATAFEAAVCAVTGDAGCAAPPAAPLVAEPAPPAGEEDGGWGQRAQDMAWAFVDGAVVGEFNRDDHTDDPWVEGSRAAGKLVSSLLVYGDVRDAYEAADRIEETGGDDGWADLGWTATAAIPIAGDVLRALRLGDEVVDVARAADEPLETMPRRPARRAPASFPDTPTFRDPASGRIFSNRTGVELPLPHVPPGFRADGTLPRNSGLPLHNQGPNPACSEVACQILADTVAPVADPAERARLIQRLRDEIAARREDPNLRGLPGSSRSERVEILRGAGIPAELRENLSIPDLAQLTSGGRPVLAGTTWGTGRETHTVVVDAVTEINGVRVLAIRNPQGTEYYQTAESFLRIWHGSAVVTRP